MLKPIRITGIIAIASLFSANSVRAIPIQSQVQEVVSHLVGVMDTSAQAAVNPKRVIVRMTTCKITVTEDTNSVYLYQEQALNNQLNQPYRQRFLKIAPTDDNQIVESQSFKPENQENWINFCNQSETKRIVKLTDLGETVCSVFLKPIISIYVGETQPGGCPANVRGAVTITNTIILHSNGMDTWDRGFDADGNQVWGAVDDSYQFRWVK